MTKDEIKECWDSWISLSNSMHEISDIHERHVQRRAQEFRDMLEKKKTAERKHRVIK